MLPNILPTNSLLTKLKMKDSSACSLCPDGNFDDCQHALLVCYHNKEVNNWVIGITKNVLPQSTLLDIITLNLDLDTDTRFPIVWFLSNVFSAVWQLRLDKKAVHLYNIRADIEAKINILRKGREEQLSLIRG